MKQNNKKIPFETGLRNSKYDFVKNSKWYWIVSGAITLIGLICLLSMGLNLGIDFTGGTVISVKTGGDLDVNTSYTSAVTQIEKILGDYGLTASTVQKQGSGSATTILIQYQDKPGTKDSNPDPNNMIYITQQVRLAINDYYNTGITTSTDPAQLGGPNDITVGSNRITATSSGDLVFSSFVAVVFAIALMLLYIVFRFESMSGLATILGLVHDVIITFAFMAIFQIPLSGSVVAALITIVGYSINNCIIVFDRVRENLKKPQLTDKSNREIANMSIKQTLVRSINTSAAVMVTVLLLAIIGVDSVRQFVGIILLGLLGGVFSSIFLVPEFWALFNKPRELAKPQYEVEVGINNTDKTAKIVEVVDE